MMFVSWLSLYVPDWMKTPNWILWDRRMTWTCYRRFCGDFKMAYDGVRLHEDIRALLIQIEEERK
ncbi:hypothetical protein Eta_0065 [Serratia phage Eta]|uniref:Uncharacterized protein n=1 Tax=Serratia phage Eta TaxID=1282995 RepID=R9VX91_9CAUD|nr:hypothetical protein Eta_0065 [Serratia phage Eta]AGN89511.1 hypothetical protein Eta_0065 [Serratia phage Eta]